MKKENNKLAYREPETLVTAVETEGFICESIVTVKLNAEVDEYVNKGMEDLVFDTDY